jgi:chromosome segregation ATPase
VADVTPNYQLEIQRKRMQIEAQRATIERQRFDIMQMDEREAGFRDLMKQANVEVQEIDHELEEMKSGDDYSAIEEQRRKMQIQEKKAQIQTNTFNIMELHDRKIRHEANMAAASKAIAELEKELGTLIKAHGDNPASLYSD